LKPRRVRFTETANHHVERERAWWLENRDHQNLFAAELEKAIEILALLPGAGTPYTQTRCPTCDVSTSGSWAATCTTRSTQTTSSFEPCGAHAGSADRRFNSPSLSCLVRLTSRFSRERRSPTLRFCPAIPRRSTAAAALLARLAASTARASRWYGLDHRAEKTIHGLRRVEDVCNIRLEHDGHCVLAHSRVKAVGTARSKIELVLRPQFVTMALGTRLSRSGHNSVARVSSLFAR
jgi:hypothetical protein